METIYSAIKKYPIELHTQTIPYCAELTDFLGELSPQAEHFLLLESAEIESKENLKSIFIAKSVLKIECTNNIVELTGLTNAGKAVLDALMENLNSSYYQRQNDQRLLVEIPKFNREQDEVNRLKNPSSLDVLRLILRTFSDPKCHPYAIFLGGFFAYEFIETFEKITEKKYEKSCADFTFYLAETLIISDHKKQTTTIIQINFDDADEARRIFETKTLTHQFDMIGQHQANIKKTAKSSKKRQSSTKNTQQRLSCDISDECFHMTVKQLKTHLYKGDIFQVVPSRTFKLACHTPLKAYQKLKQTNPSPYMFYMHHPKYVVFGASPESALKYDKQTNQVEIYPIAGTRKRAKRADGSIDLDKDTKIELELRRDKKELAEHMMLVDLARNDIARISQPNTRYVNALLSVDRYSHVMHLVSKVSGTLATDLDALHAYQACMNMGTLTGAPKIKAMQLIKEVEKKNRGTYGGAMGYITGDGTMDTCIIIRSAFVKNNTAYVQAGAGVVFDSDPVSEAQETRNKAQAVLNAIALAQEEK